MQGVFDQVKGSSTTLQITRGQLAQIAMKIKNISDQLKAVLSQRQAILNQIQAHSQTRPVQPNQSNFPTEEAYNLALSKYNQDLAAEKPPFKHRW